MLFMNIARKFGSVYQEEAGADGAAGGGGAPAAAPAAEAAEPEKAPAKETPAITEPAKAVPEAHPMDAYVEQYAAEKPALSLALGWLKDAGISPTDEAFSIAETTGDFTMLEALLATKEVKGSEQMLAILKGAVAEHQEAVEAHHRQSEETVRGILGESHEAVLAWASENADPEEKEAINSLLAAGGIYARAAAHMLRDAYSQADVTQPAHNPVKAVAPAQGGHLTAREYSDAVDALSKKIGGDPRNHPEYAVLTARRAASRKAGY